MFTSLTAMVLSSLVSTVAATALPSWQTDYSRAMALATEFKKPIAVFISEGSQARLISGEGFTDETTRLLRDKFIPLHVDTTTAAGKKLADSFDLKSGLVISDSTGKLQALRHNGSLNVDTLKDYLENYSDKKTVSQTDYRGVVTTAAPASYTFVPSAYSGFSPSMGGFSSCPNCRR